MDREVKDEKASKSVVHRGNRLRSGKHVCGVSHHTGTRPGYRRVGL